MSDIAEGVKNSLILFIYFFNMGHVKNNFTYTLLDYLLKVFSDVPFCTTDIPRCLDTKYVITL